MSEDEVVEVDFEVGDLVELNCGSPIMTIIETWEDERQTWVQTAWVTECGQPMFADYPEACVRWIEVFD